MVIPSPPVAPLPYWPPRWVSGTHKLTVASPPHTHTLQHQYHNNTTIDSQRIPQDIQPIPFYQAMKGHPINQPEGNKNHHQHLECSPLESPKPDPTATTDCLLPSTLASDLPQSHIPTLPAPETSTSSPRSTFLSGPSTATTDPRGQSHLAYHESPTPSSKARSPKRNSQLQPPDPHTPQNPQHLQFKPMQLPSIKSTNKRSLFPRLQTSPNTSHMIPVNSPPASLTYPPQTVVALPTFAADC